MQFILIQEVNHPLSLLIPFAITQELIYHSVAFVLYIVASVWFLVRVTDKAYGNQYEEFMVAAVLGLVVSVLYLLSAIYAQRSYRGL